MTAVENSFPVSAPKENPVFLLAVPPEPGANLLSDAYTAV